MRDIDYFIEDINDMISSGLDTIGILEYAQNLIDNKYITENRDIEKLTNKLQIEVLDVDKFVKVNNCREVTSPTLYDRPGEPNDEGLLSFNIFGMTPDDKSGIFAYIDLHKYFLSPVCYKAWFKIDPQIKHCIAKLKYYSLDKDGYIVEDPRGETGLEFLKKNINKIKFRKSENSSSIYRDIKADFLDKNRNNMFINKYLVIPVFYRDTNSKDAKKGTIGVSKINKLYQQLILNAMRIQDTQEYGFDMSGDMDLRLQETLLCIYDWFCGTNNSNILKTETGIGIKGKTGIFKSANQSKTSDYAARLVLTSTELKANTPKEMKADFDTSLVPLSAAMASFAPFVRFAVRRFFEKEFVGTETYPVLSAGGKVSYKHVKEPFIQFSDDRIVEEMEQFIHGYNNRLIPIEIEFEDGSKVYMQFKGFNKPIKSSPETIYNRRLTWLDVFYICTKEAVRDKMALMTRFPVDSRTNQIITQIDISSTNETEPMYVNEVFYPNYPKFSDSDIGKDTSNMFIDTLNISNLYTAGMQADFDGDTVTVRGVFTKEANEELRNFQNTKRNFIGLGAKNLRTVASDVVQSLYSLTKILPEDKDKLTTPEF